ncbi:MAG: hypothetical protein HY942_00960 [Gammaproteobacteria bacterium]|nr:hypothetical protein [Gammaproteobacteria bacterium]
MITIKHLGLYAALIAASALFLVLQQLTHVEFLLHLAAIPLEILLGALLVERFLERREKAERRRQLVHIKSYHFRGVMCGLFIADLQALKQPVLAIPEIRRAGLAELRDMRRRAEHVEYGSDEKVEAVVMEYLKARDVFRDFMEWAITHDFETIFHGMIYVLNFIQDVELFKRRHPDGLFVAEAQRRRELGEKLYKVLGDGVRSFLDHAIELKEQHPEMFEELLADYELSASMA